MVVLLGRPRVILPCAIPAGVDGPPGQVIAAQDVTMLAELERTRLVPARGRAFYLLTADESQGLAMAR